MKIRNLLMLPVLIILAVAMLMIIPVKGMAQVSPLSFSGSDNIVTVPSLEVSPDVRASGGGAAALSIDVVITSNLSEEVLIVKDLKNNLDVVNSIAPAAHAASVNGSGADLQGFEGAVVAFTVGTITDGTHTPKVQESDDDSTYTDVAAADLEGTLAALASDVNQRVGYKGNKRYVRGVSTVAGATTGGVYAGVVVRGLPHRAPVA